MESTIYLVEKYSCREWTPVAAIPLSKSFSDAATFAEWQARIDPGNLFRVRAYAPVGDASALQGVYSPRRIPEPHSIALLRKGDHDG